MRRYVPPSYSCRPGWGVRVLGPRRAPNQLEEGLLHLAQQLVRGFKGRPKAHLALAVIVVANQFSIVAFAAAPPATLVLNRTLHTVKQGAAACVTGAERSGSGCISGGLPVDASVSVPAGSEQCPASGAGAACPSDGLAAAVTPGVASTPDGHSPCPTASDNPISPSPAACTDILLPSAPAAKVVQGGDSLAPPQVTPSVPVSTLRPRRSQPRLDLTSGADYLQAGDKAILTATAASSMTGTPNAIEIFDQTTNTLAGSCTQSSQCIVAYAATSGAHTFAAFITRPCTPIPPAGASPASNAVRVTWLGITLAASTNLVAPGKPVTFTATSTFDVGKAGRAIVIYDNTTKQKLTYCTRGTTCSTSVTLSSGGLHAIVGWLPGQPEAISQAISTTWLGASLSADTISSQAGGTVHLTATANTDLADTPWSLGIYDEHGQLVGQACKVGNTCSAVTTVTSHDMPYFSAVIGAVPPISASSTLGQLLRKVAGPTSLVDIQTSSAPVQPTRILWGVDSCKLFTTSPTGADGLYPQIVGRLGAPDFWGRYLTNTGCAGITPVEIAAAAHLHMAMLPIYNDYNCSNVVGYSTGQTYAAEATAAAAGLGIPQSRAIAIDIEPPGDACPGAVNVDSGFITGWFDGVATAGYAPTYYGNGTAGSEFASAWCAAVAAQPSVLTYSFLWSFQPSLLGRFSKGTAPGYSPHQTQCGGAMVGWQYQIDDGDVDHDQALSVLPLWFP